MAHITPIHPLGSAIKRALSEHGVRVKDLAEHLNVNQSSVTRWQTGGRVPDIVTLQAIERYCGLRRGELLIDAGLVELPVKPEELAQLDTRLDDAHRRLACSYYVSCLRGSESPSTSSKVVAKVRKSESKTERVSA